MAAAVLRAAAFWGGVELLAFEAVDAGVVCSKNHHDSSLELTSSGAGAIS